MCLKEMDGSDVRGHGQQSNHEIIDSVVAVVLRQANWGRHAPHGSIMLLSKSVISESDFKLVLMMSQNCCSTARRSQVGFPGRGVCVH